MTDKPPKPPKTSGEHKAVRDYRAKLDSLELTQLPELVAARQRLEKLAQDRTDEEDGPPTPKVKRKDARREDDASIPPDVVDIKPESKR